MRQFHKPQTVRAAATMVLALTMAAFSVQTAVAIIFGGEGNGATHDPGWPTGADVIFDNQARIAWWVGDSIGGGQQWHSECRGDARAFNVVLADYAKVDVKTKRVVVHNGVGNSRWLNINNEPAGRAAARIDWTFVTGQPNSPNPPRMVLGSLLSPAEVRAAKQIPPAQIDVYTGGNIRWADVTVPKGIEIIDERLEAHGFTLADGAVLEGEVVDLQTHRPLAARILLQRIGPQVKGTFEYQYTVVSKTVADAQGHWVLKKSPAGWYRVIAEADGYVPRAAGYARFYDEPSWQSCACGLAHPALVSGQVKDDAGKALADVMVRLDQVVAGEGEGYASLHDYSVQTDADGRFRFDQVPAGSARIWVRKSGYCRPGLGQPITTPAKDVALTMKKSSRIHVTVDFAGTVRPKEYMVDIKPAGREVVGSWGGAGRIDTKNQILFNDVPPGRYVLQGHPNPSSENERTEPVTVDLKGGQTAQVTLSTQ